MDNDRDSRVPTAHFDGSGLSPAERLAEWSKLTPGYDVAVPEGVPMEEFTIDCRAWLIDDLVLTANSVGPAELLRTPAHITEFGRNTYTLILLQRGEWWADLDYGSIQVGSGQVCIMDFTVPWHVRGTAQANVMLVVPRAVAAAIAPDAPRLHGRLLEGASGRLFAEHMLALARHLPEMMQRDVPLVRNAILGLLGSALTALAKEAPVTPSSSIRAASIGGIRSFIDANLTDQNLGAARICRELPVTRATLYRAFQSVGGVTSYIQRRRLEAAHARLSDSSEPGTMAEIADHFCFSSPAHFSTAFRRRFGYTPRDARNTSGRPLDASTLFRTWVDILGDDADAAGS